MNVRDCVAVVTGGSSGLGEAAITRIVESGGKVVIVDLSEEKGAAVVQRLGSNNVIFTKADVANEEDIKAALQEGIVKFGKINTVINCAGIGQPKKVVGREGVHDLEGFNRTIQVNLIGTFNVIRLAAEIMIENIANDEGERGVIINTASVAAFEGQIGQAAYSASKGGIVAMTLPIARELARHGIRVMTIAPGLIHTPLFDTLSEQARESLGASVPFPQRLGYPSEFAMLVTSIIENPMLNGETIRLDGAIRMQPK
ncbi:3-hydroxyacyl-CoA dehydrogenase [Bacillus benzoevorans]|uniref:NAD(P)-dependent dehydrogenase (Short-subunit alcohol dehydrogenase family) n=1 Tax=Bacillus benzoevorans TaxID=1456 RepID=A0A7X0HVX3_9BACI|nr:3-hydroxyacyl-CoA dehydrogenase [Bacillus benzoevorans]MBB6446600.1 NAD(P)-dependent dehydrogenase (short-subunit alcohol dehydrogenase family) [Bacillus benzoevorans]